MSKYDKILQDYDRHCQRIAQATTIHLNERPEDKNDV